MPSGRTGRLDSRGPGKARGSSLSGDVRRLRCPGAGPFERRKVPTRDGAAPGAPARLRLLGNGGSSCHRAVSSRDLRPERAGKHIGEH